MLHRFDEASQRHTTDLRFLRQRLPHRDVPMAGGTQLISEQPSSASRDAHSMVCPHRTHYVLCEHLDIDIDARPPTRLGLPRELWD